MLAFFLLTFSTAQALQSPEDFCDVVFNQHCFVAVTDKLADREGAIEICESMGGSMANLYSVEQEKAIVEYINNNFMRLRTDLRLGMTYDAETSSLKNRDGNPAATDLLWAYRWPRKFHPTWSDVILTAARRLSDKKKRTEEWLTHKPSKNLYNVLCEFEL